MEAVAGASTLDALIRADPEFWFRQCAEIKTKEGMVIRGPVIRPRVCQIELFRAYRECRKQHKPCLIMLLKPRQDGGSTGVQALIYHHLQKFPGLNGAVMGDIAGTSDTVFGIFQWLARNDHFKWGLPIEADLDDDITLGNGSHYGKETAMSKNAGRSGTVQVANTTEVAFFPRGEKDPALAFLNSLSTEGETTLGVMDSTPNGPFGTFFKYWMNKDNGWTKIFIPWFCEPDHIKAFSDPDETEEFRRSMTDDEREEQLKFKLSLEQLAWRRRMIKVKCEGDVEKFRSEYPSDDISCFFRSSRFRFNVTKITEMEKLADRITPKRGELTLLDDMRASFTPDPAGSIDIYEDPKIGCRYIGIGDTMTGEDQVSDKPQADPDYHALGIIRAGYRDTRGFWLCPRVVAFHWSRVEQYVAANIMAALSIYYGRCIVFPEVNNCGLTMVKKLNEIGISVYSRRIINKTAGTTDKQLGWLTNETTRKTIIDHLAQMVNEWNPQEPTIDIPHPWILGQMKTFIISRNSRPEAMSGTHDDGVLFSAIGFYNVQASATELKEHRRKIDIQKARAAGGWQMG